MIAEWLERAAVSYNANTITGREAWLAGIGFEGQTPCKWAALPAEVQLELARDYAEEIIAKYS